MSNSVIIENLKALKNTKKMETSIVLWGIGVQTAEITQWIKNEYGNDKIIAIVDNFKYTFWNKWEGIPIIRPYELAEMKQDDFIVLLSTDFAESICRQLSLYNILRVYNLRDLNWDYKSKKSDIPYHFIDRSRGSNNLCYILAGYERGLWDNTLKRLSLFKDDSFDYCIVSSGIFDKELESIAKENGWSYLYTDRNQVCFIQNLVLQLHPNAKYIIKMDEDIFISEGFFKQMISQYQHIEEQGEYRIGFAVPVIPLNCCGYVSYLKLIGKKEEYESNFGRAYRSRYSAVQDVVETAEYFWNTMDSFDNMAERFLKNTGYSVLDSYYNIGCIMYTRERWAMMGGWPDNNEGSGMGGDERWICADNREKDMAIYEIFNVLAGHLAFGCQKKRMMQYYQEHPEKFAIRQGVCQMSQKDSIK